MGIAAWKSLSQLTDGAVVFELGIPKLNAPMVLVHGLCGFDRLYAFRRPVIDYFPGVRQQLQASGNRVFTPRLSPTAGIPRRAMELKHYIEENIPAGPIHVVGHSLGGLDARYMIGKLG